MPIYEFKCNDCGECFELILFASDDKESLTCPSCGNDKIQRIVSSFSCGNKASGDGLGNSLGSGSCSPTGGFS